LSADLKTTAAISTATALASIAAVITAATTAAAAFSREIRDAK
jgi:hypothetical protein